MLQTDAGSGIDVGEVDGGEETVTVEEEEVDGEVRIFVKINTDYFTSHQ